MAKSLSQPRSLLGSEPRGGPWGCLQTPSAGLRRPLDTQPVTPCGTLSLSSDVSSAASGISVSVAPSSPGGPL